MSKLNQNHNFWNNILTELKFQADMALDALEQVNVDLKINCNPQQMQQALLDHAKNNPFTPFSTPPGIIKCYRNLHSFIVLHSNISKLLCWSGKFQENHVILAMDSSNTNDKAKNEVIVTLEAEASAIQDKLKTLAKGLKTFNVKNRQLRNNIEHYEERIIPAAFSSGNITSIRLCNSKNFNDRAIDRTLSAYMREYVIDEKKYYFRGELSGDLSKMEKDIRELQARISKNIP